MKINFEIILCILDCPKKQKSWNIKNTSKPWI